jgi:hypothetical protein
MLSLILLGHHSPLICFLHLGGWSGMPFVGFRVRPGTAGWLGYPHGLETPWISYGDLAYNDQSIQPNWNDGEDSRKEAELFSLVKFSIIYTGWCVRNVGDIMGEHDFSQEKCCLKDDFTILHQQNKWFFMGMQLDMGIYLDEFDDDQSLRPYYKW